MHTSLNRCIGHVLSIICDLGRIVYLIILTFSVHFIFSAICNPKLCRINHSGIREFAVTLKFVVVFHV